MHHNRCWWNVYHAVKSSLLMIHHMIIMYTHNCQFRFFKFVCVELQLHNFDDYIIIIFPKRALRKRLVNTALHAWYYYVYLYINTSLFCCSFEQEVLGGPMPVSGNPPVLEAVPVPVALPLPAVVRPIIGTNTYRQVCTLLIAWALIEMLRGVLQSNN